jgi:phosphonate transport system substrate-binding protein
VIDSFVDNRLDAAFFGSFTYALAHARLAVQVLARPESFDGVSTYHGLIFVRRDSMITSIGRMKGKRLALVDKATTAGYLLPLSYFRKNRFDYRIELQEIYFSGTHEDTIYDVLSGKADIGAAKNTVYERLADSNRAIKEELVVLERSPFVPENALAVRQDLEVSVKQLLAKALLTMHNDEEGRKVLRQFGARRFITTVDSDYLPVYHYAREAGIDLATYNYSNENLRRKAIPETALLSDRSH